MPSKPSDLHSDLLSTATDGIAAALDFGRDTAATITPLDVPGINDPVILVEHAAGRTVELLAESFADRRDAPSRRYGTTTLHQPASLVEWVNRTKSDQTPALYADVDTFTLVAVLNPSDSAPTWQDHRGVVTLRPHPLWKRWADLDGKLIAQQDFAEHVQMCSSDVADPPALDLLEVAETLSLHIGSKVSSAFRNRDGSRHIVFDENIEASAGDAAREVDIPEVITIRVPIFDGGPIVAVRIRLMYRRVQGSVAFLLQVVDRVELIRDQFELVVAQVAEDLDVCPLYGRPAGRS